MHALVTEVNKYIYYIHILPLQLNKCFSNTHINIKRDATATVNTVRPDSDVRFNEVNVSWFLSLVLDLLEPQSDLLRTHFSGGLQSGLQGDITYQKQGF